MAEEISTPAGVAADNGNADTKEAKKPKSPRRKRSEPSRGASKALAAKTTAKSRRHSDQEKLEKLRLIEGQLATGATTLKDAVKSAGIAEQTYYNWKSSLKPTSSTQPVSPADAPDELVELEAENQRLRKLLAEKLNAENADLRKRLGLN